jgi:hypothetical protein
MTEGYSLSARHLSRLWFYTRAGFFTSRLMPLSAKQKTQMAATLTGMACIAIPSVLKNIQAPNKSGAAATQPARPSEHHASELSHESYSESTPSNHPAPPTHPSRPPRPPSLSRPADIKKSADTATKALPVDQHRGSSATELTARAATSLNPGPSTPPDHEVTPLESSESALPPLIVPFSPGDRSTPATIPAAMAATTESSTTSATPTDPHAVVHNLASRFLHDIEGASNDTTDPAYQHRWLEAQVESDAHLRASLGGHEWLKLHQEAHQQAQLDQSAEGQADGQ